MRQQPRPIFGFLWRRPDPDAPVDAAYVQERLIRVISRGPIRILFLALASLAAVMLAATAVMTALSAPLSVASLLGAAIAATAVALLLRGWVVGTYVTDAGVTVDSMWRRTFTPWSEVASIEAIPARVPFLGLPMRITGERVFIHVKNGPAIATHISSRSPDTCCRSDAFDIARIRLENWADRA